MRTRNKAKGKFELPREPNCSGRETRSPNSSAAETVTEREFSNERELGTDLSRKPRNLHYRFRLGICLLTR
jgi:hypothetical protein